VGVAAETGTRTAIVSWQRRPEISVADLVRALATLRPTDDGTQDAIARFLGIQPAARPAAPPGDTSPRTTRPTTRSGPRPRPAADQPGTAGAAAEPEGETSSGPVAQPSTIEVTVEQVSGPQPDREPLARTPSDESALRPPLEPLFLPRWTRGILSAALATDSGDGPVDVPRLVEMLATRAPIERLPRQTVPTLRRGVRVFVDGSRAMMPFYRDQAELGPALRDVVGHDRVHVRRFVGRPMGDDDEPRSPIDQLPPSGTVVLLLTDLGIGHPPLASEAASVEEWKQFAAQVRRAGCALVAFVPYAERRWSADLTRAMCVLHWGRPTTAGAVRRRVGPAHRVNR
jgi:hypothetical protein